MRDYTTAELEWEYNNEYVKRAWNIWPHLFPDFAAFIAAYHNARLTPIDPCTQTLDNFSGPYDNILQVKSAMSHRRDVQRIVDGFTDGTLPPPLLIKSRGFHFHVMSGNTRLAVVSALRKCIDCKILGV